MATAFCRNVSSLDSVARARLAGPQIRRANQPAVALSGPPAAGAAPGIDEEATMLHLLAVLSALLATGAVLGGAARADEAQLERGRRAIESMAGCFLVDYSYAETDSLRPGYVRDGRVYDVNRDKSVKEWIFAETVSPRRIQLNHILFATDLRGALREGSELRHQTEDWEYDAPFLYEFVGRSTWTVKDLRGATGRWTRRITNLDEGLRYQCDAPWRGDTAFADWSCRNYAPIPGRETRDMGRKDYDALDRGTRLVLYEGSWLERQDNVKTIHGADGVRTPLAREVGKTWYVRLPDAECAPGRRFAEPRRAFWAVLRQTWDEVLIGDRPFVERTPPGRPPRFAEMMDVEDRYAPQDLTDPAVRAAAREAILRVIDAYRSP